MLNAPQRTPQTPDNDDHPEDREWTLFIVLAVLLSGGSALFLLVYWFFA